MSKAVFYIDEDFVLSTEHHNDESLVVHCNVFRNSHGVMKKICKEFAKLTLDAEAGGYVYLDTYSPNPKFCEMWGFTHMGIDFEYEGKMHSHYRYELMNILKGGV